MAVRTAVPEGLARMAPGPELAAVLAGIDLASLEPVDAVGVLRATKRQQNHAQAAMFTAIVDVGARNTDPSAPPLYVDEWGTEEVRAALVLTRVGAVCEVNFAEGVVLRLPEVHAAMFAGRVDRTRSWLLWSMTEHMSEAHARAVCARLLPKCHTWTPGQLAAKIAKTAIALDPGWQEARTKASLKERRVVGSMNEDGTADLCGYHLPADRVIAACGRMDELAKAAKRGGDPRGIDFLRAELYAGLLDGTFEGLTDDEILIHLACTRPDPTDPVDAEPEAEATAEAAAARAEATAAAEAEAAAARAVAEAVAAEAAAVEEAAAANEGEAAPRSRRADGVPLGGWLREHNLPEPPRIGLELQVRLSTLLGLDQAPAELAAWGPIHPDYARDLCAELGPAQWRFAITDSQGYLITAGLTPARPTGVRLRRWPCRAIVELQIPETLLRALRSGDLTADHVADPAAFTAWAPVIADIARRIDGPANVGTDHPPGPKPLDPRRRTPGAALRRETQIRKRRCMAPGCRAPARSADIDHTLDHAYGGLTIDINLAPLCRHHHRMKHEGGWTLHFLPDENTYLWRSRLGIEYRVPIPPIIEELPEPHHDPDPQPIHERRIDPARDLDNTPWQQSSSWHAPPPRPPAPEPPPPPPRPTTPDEPPF